MKKLLLVLFMLAFTAKIYPQCFNSDFSNGDFSSWVGTTGENSGGTYSNEVVGLNQGTTNSLPTDPGQQTIINAPGTDPNTNNQLSVLPPGGSSCARLGNELTNYGAERLVYPLSVNSSNCIFTYQYAVVLEDPAHTITDQPKFTIYVVDSALHVVDPVCGVYEVSSQSGLSGWHDATHAADGELDHWKDWTTVGIDLSAYIGQTINIVFTTFDCAQGAHFGYAYIACHCGTYLLQQQCAGSSDILTAPPGFNTYTWSTGETGSSITINNPVNGDTVTCNCLSVQGCSMTLVIVLNIQPVNFTVNSPTICSGTPAALTATGTGYTYAWSDGQNGQTISVSPTTTTTYTCSATASGGCSDTMHATVTVDLTTSSITSTDSVLCFGGSTGSATASATAGTPGFTYAWSNGQSTATATNLQVGTYTCTVSDNLGCTSTVSTTVYQPADISSNLTPVDEGCPGSCTGSITSSISGGIGPYLYTWNNGQLTSDISSLCAGTYTVTVTDNHNCQKVINANVGTNSNILASCTAVPSTGIIPLNVNFTFTGTGATSYLWDLGDGTTSTLQDPQHIYDAAGTYNVVLIVSTGAPDNCQDTVTITIVADLPSFLIVPNVFTPNGDNLNDDFHVKYQSITSFNCMIFNRWGKKIYEWSDVSKGWDGKTEGGKQCSDGVYYYILSAKGVDNIEYDMHGTVTLLK